eukprot:1839746-Amphidinium_carterae.1
MLLLDILDYLLEQFLRVLVHPSLQPLCDRQIPCMRFATLVLFLQSLWSLFAQVPLSTTTSNFWKLATAGGQHVTLASLLTKVARNKVCVSHQLNDGAGTSRQLVCPYLSDVPLTPCATPSFQGSLHLQHFNA